MRAFRLANPKSITISDQCGLTKIFFRAGKVAMLDELDDITPEQHEHLVARVKRWFIRRRWRMAAAKAVALKKATDLYRSVHAMRLWSKGAGLMLVYMRTLRRTYFAVKQRVAARTLARACKMWPVRQEYLRKTLETRERKAATLIQSMCRTHLGKQDYQKQLAAAREAAAALVLQRLCRMVSTKKETADLFRTLKEAPAARTLQAVCRASAERKQFAIARAEMQTAAEVVQRFYRAISGETGLRFKGIVSQLRAARAAFDAEMDALVAKYTDRDAAPLGSKKLFKGGGGGGGFEMWVSIKIVDPSMGSVDLRAAEFSDGRVQEEVFAGQWMKLKKAEGVLGEFFSDPANACTKDKECVQQRPAR